MRARSFGNPVTLEDIEKHFRRKKPNFEAHNPDVDLPTSPTPSNISCTSLSRSPSPEPTAAPKQPLSEGTTSGLPLSSETNSYSSSSFSGQSDLLDPSAPDQVPFLPHRNNIVGFPVHHHDFGNNASSHVCPTMFMPSQMPRPMIIDSVERGFFNLRDLIDVDFAAINHKYPSWWKSLDSIATDFDDAQLSWMASRHDQARSSYDKVLAAVTPYAQMPSIALLQLVSYLLSWTAYSVSKDLVQSLFAYLDRLEKVNPDLAYMLGCLANPDHAKCAISLYQNCVSKYLTTGHGANSMTVLRMNMKLCRHAFATDDQEPAWVLLREIRNLRTIYQESTTGLITPELEEELDNTLQLFEDRTIAKTSLEDAMSACNIDEASTDQFEVTHGAQQHSMCNFKLGLYAVAHKQAKATLTCFRKLYGNDDPRAASAKALLDRAEMLKNEVHDAGIDWPTGDFHDWNETAQYLSPETICGSPSTFDQPFTPKSYTTKRLSRGSFQSQRRPPPPRSYPQPDELSIYDFPRHTGIQRMSSWPLSDTTSISDDYAVYSPAFANSPGYQFMAPTSAPADNLVFELED